MIKLKIFVSLITFIFINNISSVKTKETCGDDIFDDYGEEIPNKIELLMTPEDKHIPQYPSLEEQHIPEDDLDYGDFLPLNIIGDNPFEPRVLKAYVPLRKLKDTVQVPKDIDETLQADSEKFKQILNVTSNSTTSTIEAPTNTTIETLTDATIIDQTNNTTIATTKVTTKTKIKVTTNIKIKATTKATTKAKTKTKTKTKTKNKTKTTTEITDEDEDEDTSEDTNGTTTTPTTIPTNITIPTTPTITPTTPTLTKTTPTTATIPTTTTTPTTTTDEEQMLQMSGEGTTTPKLYTIYFLEEDGLLYRYKIINRKKVYVTEDGDETTEKFEMPPKQYEISEMKTKQIGTHVYRWVIVNNKQIWVDKDCRELEVARYESNLKINETTLESRRYRYFRQRNVRYFIDQDGNPFEYNKNSVIAVAKETTVVTTMTTTTIAEDKNIKGQKEEEFDDDDEEEEGGGKKRKKWKPSDNAPEFPVIG